jgi:hypothetical protein
MDTGETGAGSSVTRRLEAVSAELKNLEPLIRAGEMDARVLREFRESVDYVRNSAWAIEQWLALRERKEDPYSVLPMLTLERVRRGTQIANDLTLDLDSTDITFETPGLEGLFGAVQGLHEKLAHLFGKDRG